MNQYKCLVKVEFDIDVFKIVPIRFEDRYYIMQWRNEQIYHLRQANPLTNLDQDKYFNDVVSKLFDEDKPNQILFSFIEDQKLVGYGGLVNINWIDRNAEISFLIKTAIENERFNIYWKKFLYLIDKVAFQELEFHKIYTYAFDLRPHLYQVLKESGFYEEARLKEHCNYKNNFIDVVIHSKINLNA